MNKRSFALFFCVAFLFAVGLVMIFNTTSAEALDRNFNEIYGSFFKQIFFGIGGVSAAIYVFKKGYLVFFKKSSYFFLIFIGLLLLVFVPGIGPPINGAHRWLAFRFFSFQPSEFMKIILPIYAIEMIVRKKVKLDAKTFYLLALSLFVPIFLILLEPDNGTVIILLTALIALFFLTKIRPIYWALPMSIFLFVAGFIAAHMKHVLDRIRIYLNPELDLLGKGHQPYQAKIAAGSGKLFGRGFGESLQKLNYLPEARSDYIAAIYAEEFGFLGIVLLILIYMAIAFIGFQIALKSKDQRGFFGAGIITFLITFQAFLNLGIVSGLLPSKGTNLPFFSQGGSSLCANLIAVALLISISERASHAS